MLIGSVAAHLQVADIILKEGGNKNEKNCSIIFSIRSVPDSLHT
jgi:hypothetical protein